MVNLNDTPSAGSLRSADFADAANNEAWVMRLATLVDCHADACSQGRKACPCPEACMQANPEPDEHLQLFRGLLLACATTAAAAALVLLLWPL